MKYKLLITNPKLKFISFEMIVENISTDTTCFQIPAWRPGRYELGNFAKNIQRWNAFDEKGNELNFTKTTKDRWEVETKGIKTIVVKYNYYAAQLDAGGSWLDDSQLYVNPINCFMYVEGRKDEKYELELQIPDAWKVAGTLKMKSKNIYIANDFDELVDSPFIASASLQQHSFTVTNKDFTISLLGECNADFMKIEKDFKAFADLQIKTMGDFPTNKFHFLIQILPYEFYHGVEHLNSTVLALGPGDKLMSDLYNDLVGVASHELFHVWNIKTIRPSEMLPYDYTKENYSRLGYVYEGFTTYYGDLFLARTGFFSLEQYLNEISIRLQKHMDNFGRYNYSVSQSSFDTWLDGYVPGIPNRKTSIYDEGSLIALMLDFKIRKATNSLKSLDDVMRILYNDFGKKKIGYTEQDIISNCEAAAGIKLHDFFDNYVYKAGSYDLLFKELIDLAGLEIKSALAEKYCERIYGMKLEKDNSKIRAIFPDSPAANAGLVKGDEIISVNGVKIKNNSDELFNQNEITLEVNTHKKSGFLKLKSSDRKYNDHYFLGIKKNISSDEKYFLKQWCNH